MATINNKKKSNKKAIIIVVILMLILILLILITRKKDSTIIQEDIQKVSAQYIEEKKQETIIQLSDKTEQERMQFYCGDFFKLIDKNNYEEAYKLLYSDYKENYFPTLNNFKTYLKEYFPSDFALAYQNIERLGDMYILNVAVKDSVNGSYGKNFNMYVVLKENSLNDYVISFSRNSAIGEEE